MNRIIQSSIADNPWFQYHTIEPRTLTSGTTMYHVKMTEHQINPCHRDELEALYVNLGKALGTPQSGHELYQIYQQAQLEENNCQCDDFANLSWEERRVWELVRNHLFGQR